MRKTDAKTTRGKVTDYFNSRKELQLIPRVTQVYTRSQSSQIVLKFPKVDERDACARILADGCPVFELQKCSSKVPRTVYPVIVRNVDVSDPTRLQSEIKYSNRTPPPYNRWKVHIRVQDNDQLVWSLKVSKWHVKIDLD